MVGNKNMPQPEQPALNFDSSQYYEDRSFTGTTHRETELCDVEFYKCRFDGCAFFKTAFRRCRFEECVFDRCDLSMMKTPDSRFTDVRFVRSKLLGVDWTLASAPATPSFEASNISHSTFQRLAMPKLVLTDSVARDVDFTGANLTKARLVRTDFLGARFADTNLSEADFSDATNYAIDPTANRVKKAIFTLPEAMSLLAAFDIVVK